MAVSNLFFEKTEQWRPDLRLPGARDVSSEDPIGVCRFAPVASEGPMPLILMASPSWLGAVASCVEKHTVQGLFVDFPDERVQLLSAMAHHAGWNWSDFAWAEWGETAWWSRWVTPDRFPWIWVWGDVPDLPEDRPIFRTHHPADFKSNPEYKKPFWRCMQMDIRPQLKIEK